MHYIFCNGSIIAIIIIMHKYKVVFGSIVVHADVSPRYKATYPFLPAWPDLT